MCNFEPREISVQRIEKKVVLRRHDHARDAEYRRNLGSRPLVSNGSGAWRRRIRSPILGQSRLVNIGDQRLFYSDSQHDVFLKEFRRLEVNQDLQNRKRLGCGCVNEWHARVVPAAAEQSRAISAESVLHVVPLDDSPSGNNHEKTPYSIRPIRFSTSRAPTSVREYASGE
jgi:hypothetical protein